MRFICNISAISCSLLKHKKLGPLSISICWYQYEFPLAITVIAFGLSSSKLYQQGTFISVQSTRNYVMFVFLSGIETIGNLQVRKRNFKIPDNFALVFQASSQGTDFPPSEVGAPH